MSQSEPPTLSDNFDFRIYNHNIRNANTNKKLVPGESPWDRRKIMIANSIRLHSQSNTIVSLQEVLKTQLDDILEILGDEWGFFGVGRMDGVSKGEFTPILYKTKEWEIIKSKVFWLSETPDIPSTGWDGIYERVVTWTYLQNKKTGSKINIFNTHLDHKGKNAQKESVKFIMNKMKTLNKSPSFLMGDFNTTPLDEPYKLVTKQFDDSSSVVDEINRYGHELTITGFKNDNGTDRIDYIWVPKRGITVKMNAVLQSRFNGIFMSDHRPVVVDISIDYNRFYK